MQGFLDSVNEIHKMSDEERRKAFPVDFKYKAFTVKWKKQTKQTTGYQIQYSTKKNFRSGTKMIKIRKNKITKKKIKNLKSKKTYYFRIRTYKTTGGKTYYSVWSKGKKVKTG